MKFGRRITNLLFATLITTAWGPAYGQGVSVATASAPSGVREPLFDNLGSLSYPITTNNELAQKYFDQGFRWAYGFNHAAARRAFQQAQRLDPTCAMCFWGEALVLGPNINAPMEQQARAPAVEAIGKAKKLSHNVGEHEQALIEALAERYSDNSGAERAALDKAYAAAMAKVHARFPDDQDIAVLYAAALMNTSPWDYWEADGETLKDGLGEAMGALEGVLARNPDHVGAIHYYIHLTEASSTPERAEPYAERIAGLMPGAGHIVHMGAHTFYRVGRFKDSIDLNKKAVEADRLYFETVQDEGPWKYGYYPHNIHFVVVSALMAGDTPTALEYARRLDGKISDEIARKVGWIQVIRQGPFFAYAQLAEPGTTLALEDPGDEFPFVKATWHYARGVAFARSGELDKARAEKASIAAIAARSDVSYPADIEFAVDDVLRIAQHVIEGRIAQSRGEWDRAVGEFRAAVEIQDDMAYLEPPFWYYPVRQSLGAAYLQAGKPEAAEEVFREPLGTLWPYGGAGGSGKHGRGRGDSQAVRASLGRGGIAGAWLAVKWGEGVQPEDERPHLKQS
jgi:tetratricopeptide (TPR) repeat protein